MISEGNPNISHSRGSCKTEEVRVGTLKLLSERITEMRGEIDKLHAIIQMQRCQKARDVYNAPEARDICPEDGQAGVASADRRLGQSKKETQTQGMAGLTWG